LQYHLAKKRLASQEHEIIGSLVRRQFFFALDLLIVNAGSCWLPVIMARTVDERAGVSDHGLYQQQYQLMLRE